MLFKSFKLKSTTTLVFRTPERKTEPPDSLKYLLTQILCPINIIGGQIFEYVCLLLKQCLCIHSNDAAAIQTNYSSICTLQIIQLNS